jgi:hypothetical protein
MVGWCCAIGRLLAVVRSASEAEIYMKSVVSKSTLGSEFDEFLFAPLGEDQNGLPLSVVSLFGRMNLDPWQEAGNLAALSAEAAGKRLALCLDTLTDPTLREAHSKATVLRLLALLPRHVSSAVQAPVVVAGAVAAHDPRTRMRTIFFIASAIALVASQLLTAHRYAPTQSEVVPGAAVPTVPTQTLPAPPGH